MYFKILLIVIVLIVSVNAEDITQNIDFIRSINDLDSEKSINLFGGLSIDKIDNDPTIEDQQQRSIIDEKFITNPIIKRTINYLKSHQLNFSFDKQDVEEGRTGKLKKIALPLLLALKLKMAVILPIVLTAIGLISFKGLAAGFLALLFSGATFFKDLLSKKHEHYTTAYITGGATPLNAEIIQQDWSRYGQVTSPQELAYNYHTLPQI